MPTRNISITEEAYDRLSRMKKEKESFSGVINRITIKKDILDFAGILNEKEADKLEKNILLARSLSRKRLRGKIIL